MRIALLFACTLLAGCAMPVRDTGQAATFFIVRTPKRSTPAAIPT